MPNEHSYVKTLARHLRGAGFFVWKIHDPYRGGVPDFFVCGDAAGIWIEAKYIQDWPKRASTLITPALTAQQRHTLGELYARGQTCLVLVGCAKLSIPFVSPKEWEHGLRTDDARARAMPTTDIPRWLQDGFDHAGSPHHQHTE